MHEGRELPNQSHAVHGTYLHYVVNVARRARRRRLRLEHEGEETGAKALYHLLRVENGRELKGRQKDKKTRTVFVCVSLGFEVLEK
ncbi:hypothetical protein SDJN02_15832, partial [Cucurbita argyrosperma subsp. argyrosperma]